MFLFVFGCGFGFGWVLFIFSWWFGFCWIGWWCSIWVGGFLEVGVMECFVVCDILVIIVWWNVRRSFIFIGMDVILVFFVLCLLIVVVYIIFLILRVYCGFGVFFVFFGCIFWFWISCFYRFCFSFGCLIVCIFDFLSSWDFGFGRIVFIFGFVGVDFCVFCNNFNWFCNVYCRYNNCFWVIY